jgi:3',5'-nucleoside bisphosphate phosphatase
MHSCLSPCGDLEMSPRAIVEKLAEKKIGLAALTDHNTSLNTPPFASLCKKAGIAVLYGMEAQTAEEIHVVVLFNNQKTALDFCAQWYTLLPDVENKPEKTGDQVYVDENDEIVGEVKKYLITSASTDLDTLEKAVHSLGGLVIPAHVDRQSFSLTSQLGVIPEGNWDALEFVRPQKSGIVLPKPYPVITGSDAHFIEHIGRRAFELDTGDEPLMHDDGEVNLEAVRAGFEKLRVNP